MVNASDYLHKLKIRLGFYYSDESKDAELTSIIEGAVEDMIGAGVPEEAFSTALFFEAIVLYARFTTVIETSSSTAYKEQYVNYLTKLRSKKYEVSAEDRG